jgi:hypothetical protein
MTKRLPCVASFREIPVRPYMTKRLKDISFCPCKGTEFLYPFRDYCFGMSCSK